VILNVFFQWMFTEARTNRYRNIRSAVLSIYIRRVDFCIKSAVVYKSRQSRLKGCQQVLCKRTISFCIEAENPGTHICCIDIIQHAITIGIQSRDIGGKGVH